MQKILVPTDFSPIAENALDYAVEIAALFSGEILLYHVYSFNPSIDYDEDYAEDDQPYVRNLENKISKEKSRISEKAKGVRITTVVEESNVFYLFKNKVDEYNVDLIVMGTKGATGLDRVIFGSVAVTALETSKRPVLVVPPDYQLHKIENVLLAIDSDRLDEKLLSPLKELLVKFHSRLTVIRINEKGKHESPESVGLELPGMESEYREIEVSNSVNETINNFVQANSFDLVCMIRREKGFFESIFKRSVTKTQVYQTKVPFLVLSEK